MNTNESRMSQETPELENYIEKYSLSSYSEQFQKIINELWYAGWIYHNFSWKKQYTELARKWNKTNPSKKITTSIWVTFKYYELEDNTQESFEDLLGIKFRVDTRNPIVSVASTQNTVQTKTEGTISPVDPTTNNKELEILYTWFRTFWNIHASEPLKWVFKRNLRLYGEPIVRYYFPEHDGIEIKKWYIAMANTYRKLFNQFPEPIQEEILELIESFNKNIALAKAWYSPTEATSWSMK